MARIFGAPVTEPGGKIALSEIEQPDARLSASPETPDVI